MTADLGAAVPAGFTLGRVLGRGGSGTVYEARQASTGRALALKVLDVDGTDGEVRRRFDRERSAMGELAGHPNIVSIVDAGVHAGRPWIAMDLCPQGSLARATEPLPVGDVLTTLHAVASALAAAHARGVLHCDVKPANILLTGYGHPALTDFGIARLAVTGTRGSTVGGYTLDHVPPEVVDGHRPTDRGDVFSLGTTAWQLLAGRPPFRGPDDSSPAAVMRRIQEQPLPELGRADVPAQLADLLALMTAKDPGRRPAAAEVARRAVAIGSANQVALGAPLSAGTVVLPATPPPQLAAWPSHHPSRPGMPQGPNTGFHTSGMGGRTGHRPDLGQMTHAGRAPAVAAPPPIAPAPARRRRDPVVTTALALAVVVALGCGGFVTWWLWPTSPTTAAAAGTGAAAPIVSGAPLPAAPAVSGAPEPGFSGQTGRLPSVPSTAPSVPSSVDPLPSQPDQVSGPPPGPVQPKITITLDCTQTTPTTCQGGSYSIGFRSQVTNQANQSLAGGCFDYSSVRGPVNYDSSFVCNSQGTIYPGGSNKLPDGDYTITERAEVQGGGTTSTTFRFSVRS